MKCLEFPQPAAPGRFRCVPFHDIADAEIAQEPEDMRAACLTSRKLDLINEVFRLGDFDLNVFARVLRALRR